ncbi:M56 family metallopeptidase [Oscillibacter sp. CU971]|uniref:M56 family metallopeptidase n=1 Tax=Oscillibacter sp. CU971 TaxID=2780102 RepID=UPI001956F001|nr:M56 family metallopeptidase [Oscillibacter sp. CU971]
MDIVQMSVQAGVLIAVIVIVRAITLYRLPKASFLALWGIVVARLLIPFSLTSRWSVYNLFAGLLRHADTAVPAGSFMVVWGDQIPASPGAAAGPSAAAPVISPLTALWIGGAAVLALVFVVLLAKNYRALRAAVPVEDHAVITKWWEEYRLFRPLAIVRSDKVDSPASIGILRPRIIFPQKMDLDNEQLIRYILVHEYIHIRRFDTLWKLLALCAVCVHWFNPLVWVMLVLLNRDLELSCDEMVLRHFGGTERASYAHSLIDMAERGRPFSFMHSYFSKNAAEERIIAIMKYKKTSLLAVVLALVLTIGMATGFTTGAVAKDNDSALPDGQTQTSQRSNEETGPQDTSSALSGLGSVNRGDERKFTPEEWAEILKKVEAGEILFFETAEEERAFWENEDNAALKESLLSKGSIDMKTFNVATDNGKEIPIDVGTEIDGIIVAENNARIVDLADGATVSLVSKGDCPFALVDNTLYKIANSNEASVKTVKASDGATYKWLSSEGDAYTDLAPGTEMPIGMVTLGKDQSIVVSLSCEDSSDCSVIEVGLKKENSSEKLVIKEAGGDFDGLSMERIVEESGEYVLYVKNTGKTSAGFSISYLIR